MYVKKNRLFYKIVSYLCLLIILVCHLFYANAATKSPIISGSGSSAISALMSVWTHNYLSQKKEKIIYQGIGSGLGLKFLQDGKFDFAISDIPLDKRILNTNHWIQLPVAISQIDIIYNLPSIKKPLILNGSVLANIYMGKIKKWNDKHIQLLNPTIKLPNKKIVLIYRNNVSGTTYTLSSYLSQISVNWAEKYGIRPIISDLPKNALGLRTNQILAQTVKNLPYSIGYADEVYATKNRVKCAELINSSGTHVLPKKLYAYAAIANVDSAQLVTMKNLTNLPGIHSWPLITTSFVILPEHGKNALNIAKFFRWALIKQGAMTDKLGYIPVPQRFSKGILAKWSEDFHF